jgi:cob(I)alamin adenosyltransferase
LRIYTKTGDRGDTGLFGGQRVPKDDLRVEAYGTADELNAVLGSALASITDPELAEVLLSLQVDLFQLGADLATPLEERTERGRITIRRIGSEEVERLEGLIDRWESELEPLKTFILPGGHPAAAALHQARAVCRRAERRCVTLLRSTSSTGGPVISDNVLIYLNRLSDLLFVLARAANRRHGISDTPWNP